MSKPIIETRGLNFGFQRENLIVRDLNLRIDDRSIYGFLGPNGAGKTTTIRLLLGLLRPLSRTISLISRSLADDYRAIYAQIGALIETPSLYLHLSGFDNLNIIRKLRDLPLAKVSQVLEMVKLEYASAIQVKKYSLGMKQRLGIAMALLSQPRLLILDEPTNGLDPGGMIEMRELLISLNRDHKITIVVSSHLLSEIEKIVTHVGIIKNGSMVFQGSIENLRNVRNPESVIRICTDNNEQAISVLGQKYNLLKREGEALEIAFNGREQVADICQLLVGQHLSVYSLEVVKDDLESKFFELIKN